MKNYIAQITIVMLLLLAAFPSVIISEYTQFIDNKFQYIYNESLNWSNDIRVTYNIENYGPRIAVSGDVIHVVFHNHYGPYGQYYGLRYIRSMDSGITWSEPINLTNSSAEQSTTSYVSEQTIAVNGSTVHVVFLGGRKVRYLRSLDNGLTWEEEKLISGGHTCSDLDIAIEGNNVHVVFTSSSESDHPAHTLLWYTKSDDDGSNWSIPKRLVGTNRFSTDPRIVCWNKTVHIAWCDMYDWYGNKQYGDVFYMRSEDNGENWTADVNLTPLNDNPNESGSARLVVDGSTLHLVYGADFLNPPTNQIYYRRSMDNGKNWSDPVVLTNSSLEIGPWDFAMEGNILFVTWPDERDYGNQQWEIYYMYSLDCGLTWSNETRLTYDPARSFGGNIAISNGIIHVVWSDTRTDNYEIWYKRTNNEPVIENYVPLTDYPVINETENITFVVNASDTDNDTLDYQWYFNGVELANETNSTYTYQSDYFSAGIHNVTVSISDVFSYTNKTWNLTVLNVNRPPEITDYLPKENVTITEFQNQTFWVSTNDPDNDTLTYQWYLNDSLVLEIQTTYLFIPNNTFSGNYSVKVSVFDGEYFANHTWIVTVINVGDLQQTINDLQTQLNQTIANYTALQAIISQLSNNLSSVWNQLNESLGNNTELKNIIGSLSQNLMIIWSELNQSLSNNTSLQSVINQLNNTLNSSAVQISALWNQLNQSSINETALRNQISALNENITNLQTQIVQLKKEKEQAETEREQSTREFWVIIGILLAVVVAAWVSAGFVRRKKE